MTDLEIKSLINQIKIRDAEITLLKQKLERHQKALNKFKEQRSETYFNEYPPRMAQKMIDEQQLEIDQILEGK